MENTDLPKRYIEKSASWLRRHNFMRLPLNNVPVEMRDYDIRSEGDWVGWKLIPSTVTDAQLDEIEAVVGLSFPPLYRRFLQSYHFYELLGLNFCRHPIHTWRDSLISLYDGYSGKPLSHGLLPFGEEPMMDAGPVCFDTRAREEDGDCPVVFWDHDWVGTDKEINPLFSNSAAMFRCLNFMAAADLSFVYHDENDPPEELPLKKALMAKFLALDADGVGRTARDYWTTWGVNPDAPPSAP